MSDTPQDRGLCPDCDNRPSCYAYRNSIKHGQAVFDCEEREAFADAGHPRQRPTVGDTPGMTIENLFSSSV